MSTVQNIFSKYNYISRERQQFHRQPNTFLHSNNSKLAFAATYYHKTIFAVHYKSTLIVLDSNNETEETLQFNLDNITTLLTIWFKMALVYIFRNLWFQYVQLHIKIKSFK